MSATPGTTPHSVTRHEWLFVALFILCMVVITTLPYWIGWQTAANPASGVQYSGFLFGLEDGNSYLAKMRQGANGNWLFKIVYTAEPHDGAFIFTPYLLLGRLAGSDAPRLIGMFHAARILFSASLIVVLYLFIAWFIPQRGARRLALILICLGAGLGWLLILFGLNAWDGLPPLDTYLPEGFSFYLFYGLPHLALARAALLGGLLCMFRALQNNGRPTGSRAVAWSVLAGVCWLIMGLCVPFYIGVIYILLGIWGLTVWLRDRRLPLDMVWRCVLAALISAPYLLYNLIVFAQNPIFKGWQAQNVLPSPPPLHYVAAYGVVGLLALGSFASVWRQAGTGGAKKGFALLIGWVAAAPILAYVPLTVQRRLLEAVFVPLGILAVITLWNSGRRRTLFIAVTLLLLLPTNLLVWLSGVQVATNPAAQVFIPDMQLDAFHWLQMHSMRGEVILSSASIGNRIPAYTDLITYIGHSPETVDYGEKLERTTRFFVGKMSQVEADNLFSDAQIRYVIACATDPRGFEIIYTKLVKGYENNACVIYKVPIHA